VQFRLSASRFSQVLSSTCLLPRWRPIVLLIACRSYHRQEVNMTSLFRRLWMEEKGQDIAEYAVMLALILVLVVGTIRLVGSNANNVFSSVASSVQ